jgi:hypothetical protein
MRVRISRLESELRRNVVVVVDAITETLKPHDEAPLLSIKVEDLTRAKATCDGHVYAGRRQRA